MIMPFDLQQLSDLEDIRQLKARYFRCIDTGNEAELASVFAEEVTIDLRDNMVAFIASSFNSDIIAQHHGHTPEIRFTGPDSAQGTWYLEDRFIDPVRGTDTAGSALYHDTYVRTADGWKVQHSEYDRVYEIVSPIDPALKVTTHLLAKTGRKAEDRVDTTQWLEWFD
jgi:hypothetical protein